MQNTRQIVWGIVLILVSSLVLFGILSLSQAEGIIHLPTATRQPSSTLPVQPSASQVFTPTPVVYICPTTVPQTCPSYVPPTLPPTPPPTQPPTLPPTLPPTGTPPVTPTRTLPALPTITATGTAIINGTLTPSRTPSPTLYLSSVPTRTTLSCGAPRSWVIYIVRKCDTLYHLGQIYGVPYTTIQRANCLVNFIIYIGQRLYVPPWAPLMPSPTFSCDTFMPTSISTFYLPFETPATETPTTFPDFPTDIPTSTDVIPTP
ncbi:MAG: LysM peptidoglycan-binding domain-containing protein [Anaerolineales bacterium]